MFASAPGVPVKFTNGLCFDGVQRVGVGRVLECVRPVRVGSGGDHSAGGGGKVLEVALPGHPCRGELIGEILCRHRMVHGGARAVRVRAGDRRRAVELVVVLDSEVVTGNVGHVVRFAGVRDPEVVRGEAVVAGQGVDLGALLFPMIVA